MIAGPRIGSHREIVSPAICGPPPSSFSLSSSPSSMPHPSNPPPPQAMFNPSSASSSSSYTTQPDDHRRRKRNRTMQSCLPCHTNKRKCSRGRPCERCIGLAITGSCVYETEDPKVMEKLDLSNPACEVHRLRRRIAELEGVVRALKGRPHPKQQRSNSSHQPNAPSSLDSPAVPSPESPTSFTRSQSQSTGPWSPRESGDHHPVIISHSKYPVFNPAHIARDHPSASPPFEHSAVYARPTRSSSFNTDFGLPLDAMCSGSSSRSDGVSLQPRQSSCPPSVKGYAEDRNVIQDDTDGRKLFLGNAAGGSLLRKLQGLTSPDLKPRLLNSELNPPEKDELITAKVAYMGLFGGEIGKRWAFDMPGSTTSSAEALKIILDALPSPELARQLLNVFLQEVDCFYHAWHTPTVVNCFETFFALPRFEQEQFSCSTLSLILAIITITLDLSMHILDDSTLPQGESQQEYYKRFTRWRSTCSQRMASCTVHCLKMASYLGHPSLECIQAQLVLALYMVNNGRCTDAWCFIGGVIKQAQCLGLHIDPSKLNPQMSTFEQELRRRIWWSIQTWDVLLGIAFGWPAGVTLNDSDLPSDRTDESLVGDDVASQAPSLPPQGVTELTYHVFNWETCLYARDMMDRIFGQAVWSWGKSTEVDGGPKYEEVGKLDATIKTWYHRVPAVMRFEPDPIELKSPQSTSAPTTTQQLTSQVFEPSSSGVGTEDIRRREPRLAKQSLLLAISQNTILLLLHRPFISHTLDNPSRPPKTVMSEEQCIRSSQVIIEAQYLLVENFPATRRFWYGWYQTFHAAMTCAWISLLRSSNSPMSGIARKCIDKAIKAFELAGGAPEDSHLRACSQLQAIQKFINRKLNPPKSITNPSQLFGAGDNALSPFAYSLGPRTMTQLASSIENGDGTITGHYEMITTPSPLQGFDRHSFRRPLTSFGAHPYQEQSQYRLGGYQGSLAHSSRSSSFRCDSEDQAHRQTGQLSETASISNFNSSSETENADQHNLSMHSSSSNSSQRLSQSPNEQRSSLSSRHLQDLDSYSSMSHLTQHQLPSIHGFLSTSPTMTYCGVGSGTSTPSLYTAHYAMGPIPYQDVNVPFPMLLMQDVHVDNQHRADGHQSGSDRFVCHSGTRANDRRSNDTSTSLDPLW